MGANTHPTTRPETDDMETKRERLKTDLNSVESVTNVRNAVIGQNTIVFETKTGDIVADVLRVLADHDAFLPAEQPAERRKHLVLIHLEDN
jgi:hypothetical protein